MALPLRFPDPAFRSEVTLSGVARALYLAAQPQFERLKGLKSLGLMSYVHDVAMHTRHQHLVGLLRIFNKLCQQPKTAGLPKSFLWSFWVRLCFAQTGHAAMSYDAEKAVLLACHLDSSFKATFRLLFQPVVDVLSRCSVCDNVCPVKDKGTEQGDEWFEGLVGGNRWRELHLWVAALKLVQDQGLLKILRAQRASADSPLGFSEQEALKLLVAPGCTWEGAVKNLNQLDFIVRDLTFAGSLGIQLDVDNLVAAANSDHEDWKLLNSLNGYLTSTLYASVPVQVASVLFQRALAANLINKKIGVEALFGLDIANAISDDELVGVLKKTAVGRDAFDSQLNRSWRAWEIDTYIDDRQIPCELEKQITAHGKQHLTRHTSARVTCYKPIRRHCLAVAISHEDSAKRPTAKAFVKLCKRLLVTQYPELDVEQLTDALLEGLLDRRCANALDTVSKRLSLLNVDVKVLRGAANAAIRRTDQKADADSQLTIRIGGYEYPYRGNPVGMQISAMHAVLAGDEELAKKLGVTREWAAEILWTDILRWQNAYFSPRPSVAVRTLLESAQARLALSVISGGEGAAIDLECYALLEAMKHPPAGVSFRVTLPNLKLLNEDGTVANEYDVVSVTLKDENAVEVWVWGVTTEANVDAKRTADLGKIQKLRDLLGNRWAGDVRVVTCYVHRDGNEICHEIDGVQTRTAYAPDNGGLA
jgi:hypothetical protein